MRLKLSRNQFILFIALVTLVITELFCRFFLGLGDPPLYIVDSKIEYMMKPDQDVKRFGNHVFVNHWGMRSPSFLKTKQSNNEFRIIVFGDSVINGGSETDQDLLATTLLQQRLASALRSPVVVGNVSAGSWGPGNWLEYVKRYGFFDADVVVLMVGSGDFSDNPTFEPLKTTHPTERPILALQEAIFRYLPRYLPSLSKQTDQPKTIISEAAIAQGDSDLRAFLSLAKAGGRNVMIFHHPDKAELLSKEFIQGHNEIKKMASSLEIPFVDLLPHYSELGLDIYRDAIHPNLIGQKAIGDALYDALIPILENYQSYLNNTTK